MSHRHKLGISGEELAINYLQKEGYKILEQNYRNKLGEIDIIAQEKSTIVFVEVKTRSSGAYGRAEEAVDLAKQHQISKVAQIYLKSKGREDSACRFDVVAIHHQGKGRPVIELIKGAFYLGSW